MELEIDKELEFDLEELMDVEDQFTILIKKEEESMTLPPTYQGVFVLKETIQQAVNNMELLSSAFEKAACDPKHYNTEFAYYLEQMSWNLYKDAQELKLRSDVLGVF